MKKLLPSLILLLVFWMVDVNLQENYFNNSGRAASGDQYLLDSIIVDAQSNIFGAGKTIPPAPGGDGGGILPVLVSLPQGAGRVITFESITDSVSCCGGGNTFNGPDGGPYASGTTDILSFEGISGIIHGGKTMFLVGVFLNDSVPADPAPPRLDFTGSDTFSVISPLLQQTFFIGDGLTGTGKGSMQQFNVPDSATRFYLGFADAFDFNGLPGYYGDDVGALTVSSPVITSIKISRKEISKSFYLYQNYPNPFNPTTTIEFSLPRTEFVTLKIFNILGEEVDVLVSKKLPPGKYKHEWDARELASGVYLYRIQAGDFVKSRKMVLLK